MNIIKPKEFYRVSHLKTQQGLWYDINGGFTGLIHGEMNFCRHNQLPMDYDEEIVGYLSATLTLESLFEWFPKNDIIRLQEYDFFIHVFESDDFKFYGKFQHYVINQRTSKLINKIVL